MLSAIWHIFPISTKPKLFTIDPHFLNHKITKRRALMFTLWTGLVKCPKVHKSLTEKRGVFPHKNIHSGMAWGPPKKLLGKRVNNAKSCWATREIFTLPPFLSSFYCIPFLHLDANLSSRVVFGVKFRVPFPKNLIKSREVFWWNIHHDVWMAG